MTAWSIHPGTQGHMAPGSPSLQTWGSLRHIPRVDKMRAYNQVNLQAGFGLLSIVSPQEVWFDEDD